MSQLSISRVRGKTRAWFSKPANVILLHRVFNHPDVTAYLQPVSGLILIILSVILTLIGGLIPSRSAAKKDPVLALRTE